MKQHLFAIIAALTAAILALFSIDTANNPYSNRSCRTYGYNSAPNTWDGFGEEAPSVLQKDNTGNVDAPQREANTTTESFPALPEAGSPLGAPPAMLATSAMTELTPELLPPLDAGMVNVTGGFDGNGQTAGYRVNPRPGEFAIAVPYDPSLLPQGFTEDDIQTYVYERQYHRWVAIQRDSVNEAELLVCSRFRPWEKGLPHTQNDLANPQDALAQLQDMMSFAPQGEGGGDSPLDFINAVLKTPEMPETSAYTPTSIKELKAADPLEGLTLMQPPTANNSGTANLSYPIEIPAGRQGMQPNLALTYSSSGGNGWLGVGWDIPIPSITVETRWGVPRYSEDWESEVYVYEGEQLVTKDNSGEFRKMAHRTNDTASIGRQNGNVRFFPRKNEVFDSIVRHGNGPDNYWWSVTHRNGVTDFYGKKHDTGAVDYNSVLCDPRTHHIAQWMLTESIDPDGNWVRYTYNKKQHRSVVNGTGNYGTQLYANEISYTGHDSAAAEYHVRFNLKDDDREDVVTNGRYGFREVTASTLCNLEVLYEDTVVRRYYFVTENDRRSNFKTRLTDVVKADSPLKDLTSDCGEIKKSPWWSDLPVNPQNPAGQDFRYALARYNFEYFNYPASGDLFSNGKYIQGLDSNGITSAFYNNNISTTALGATRGAGWNGGGTVTVGVADNNLFISDFNVGGNFSYSQSYTEGLLTLIDLNGDGLSDKVFKKDGVIYYRPQIIDTSDSLKFHFGNAVPVPGIHDFLYEESHQPSFGAQGSVLSVLAASAGLPTTVSTTTTYFTDINGDGLPDKVSSNGSVALNIGYSFLPFEQWNCGAVRRGSSHNEGLNIGPGSINIAQASISGGMGVNKSENNTEVMLMDMNSDGLPDRVSRVDNGLFVRYSLGNGQWTQPVLIPGIPNISYGASYSESANIGVTAGFTLFGFLKITAGVQTSPYNKTFSKDKVQLTDINGDGYPDYVTSNSETFMRVRYNQSGKTNLLRKVTNFTGASMEMDYALSEQCFDKPQRGWLLDTLIVSDANSPVAGNVTHTKFKYENPNYNRTERMDYGYGRVTTKQYDVDNNDTPYRYTVEEYNNRDFTKWGRKTRDCVYDAAGNPYVEHIYGDTLYDFSESLVSDNGCARTDIYVKKETDITNWYEGQQTPQITSVTMREYDRYRNVKEYTHKGDTTHKDEYFRAVIEYAQNMPHNLVSLPLSIVVYDDSDNILQLRTAEYSDSGKLTRLSRYSDYSHVSQYDFSYDQYGNLATSTLPENDSLQQLEFEYEYDNVVHTYPVRVENTSLGYFSTAGYDLRFGKPTVTTDINGNEMRYRYDCLGRNTHIIAPYELAAGKPYTIKMEYHPKFFGKVTLASGGNGQNYAITYHYDPMHPNNPIRTVILTDGLGRMLQTRKDAEIIGNEQFVVTGKVVYDCFGRTVEQYQPFPHDTLNLDIYLPDCDTSRRTVCEYDILDRQIHTTVHPYGYTTDIEYGFGSVGNKTCFRTVTTDAMGNADTVLKGTMGQQLEQRSPMGAVTRFVYDHLGQLKQTTDPDGLSTYYDYDWFGQLTHRHHPDAGNDWYKYDAMGNMVCHVNALGDSVKNRYYFSLLTNVEFPRYPANNVHYQYGTASDTAINAVGKIKFQEDGSGFQTFKYGKLGELTENIRTFALPFENQTYTFKMQYEYDSWNRIQKMTYPDGEVVHYDYNFGGMLEKVYGQYKRSNMEPQIPIPLPHDSLIVQPMQMNTMGLNVSPGDIGPFPLYTIYTYPYIDSIAYNEFELKSEVFYGNGTHTQYDYDSIQRLRILQSQTRAGVDMQDITYTYDAVGNITGISNAANYPGMNLGGTYSHSYEYDDLYRLTYSTGTWEDRPYHLGLVDTVRMAYHKNGRIARKNVFALTMSPTQMGVTNYNRRYDYSGQRNTLSNVYDSVANTSQNFSWNNSGNMVAHDGRSLTWTEDNRLQTVTDNEWFSYYQYDAGGDRTYKLPYLKTYSNRSGRRSVYWAPEHSTLYASPYLVVTPQGYTKHYYAESERITSQIGRGNFSTLATPVTDTATANRKVRRADSLVLVLNPSITDTAAQLSYLTTLTNRQKDTCEAYWYHTDHLGSSSWITDSAGNAIQHLHYLPWGEDFVDQRSSNWNAMYTFSAKEKDTETGYSYFGARYYSSDLSIWLSVDPMSDKYPSLSPYVYCADNPVKLVDPEGEDIILYFYLGKNGESSSKLLAEIINKGLEGQFKTKFTKNKDGKYVLSLTPTDNGGNVSKMSAEAKAFYEELSSMINDHNTEASIDVVYGSEDVAIGNYNSNKIDIADIDQFDNMGEGLCSKQGKLIHELVEQFGKAKDGVPKGSNDNYQKNHKKGIVSENKVNGSIRGQDRYDRGVYKTTYSKNGHSTTYSYSTAKPIIKVNKSW